MSWLQSAKDLVVKSRSNPFGCSEPEPKKVSLPEAPPAPVDAPPEPVEPPVAIVLPTYRPDEFVVWDYLTAWHKSETLCARYPLLLEQGSGGLQAPVLLVEMLDTLGTTTRLLDWLQTQFGKQVFEHRDEPVAEFLGIVRTARTFTAPDPTVSASVPVAVFFYPTVSVLEELSRRIPLAKVRLVVVLDDVYCTAARLLRVAARTSLLFVKALPKDAVIQCFGLLQHAWKLSLLQQEFWIARTGADPRALVNHLYFERLQRQTAGLTWDVDLLWDWRRWVNFWFCHGMAQLAEYQYAQSVDSRIPGVLHYRTMPDGCMSVIAWDYAKLPPADAKIKMYPSMVDLDTDMALAYLHYTAPKLFVVEHSTCEDQHACADTMDMLSLADLQQSRFTPEINWLHKEAVRYGFRRLHRAPAPPASHQNDNFYSFLVQRRPRQPVVCEIAPVVCLHKHETLPRLLFLADATQQVTFWPQPAATLAEYMQQWTAAQADLPEMTVDQQTAWCLVWAFVAQNGPVPTRPPAQAYRIKPTVVKTCPHGHSAFTYCFQCGTTPSEPVRRCAQYCKGDWACLLCRAYNMRIAGLVTRGRALEKI